MIEAKLLQITVAGLTTGAIYALMALGFHLVFVTARTLDFAYGAVVVMGGLVAYSLVVEWSLPLPLVLILVTLFGGAVGLGVSTAIIWPLRDRHPAAQVISLLAAGLVVENVAAVIWGKDSLPFPPFTSDTPIFILGAAVNPQSFWVIGLSLSALIASNLILYKTRLGRVLRATANDPFAARLMGINVKNMYGVAFATSLGLGTLGGTIISPITFAGGYFALPLTVKGFTASILGGIGTPFGAVMGGFLLGFIEAYMAGLITTSYMGAISMAILLVILLLRPEGLFSSKGG